MNNLSVFVVPLVVGVVGLCPSTLCLAQLHSGEGILPAGATSLVGSELSGLDQVQSGPDAPGQPDATQTPEGTRPVLPRLGIAVKVSPLGVGIEGATAVTQRSNVRVGFNDFSFSKDFTKDGTNYGGTLTLRSLAVLYDQYLVGGLHVSPGLLAYDGNRGNASVTVPGGQSFTLGGVTYFSSATAPVAGTATLNFGRKVAPAVLLGYGNLLPRSKRRFTVNFDVGVVFQGSPSATLNLGGSTCNSLGTVCTSISSNPGIQSNIQSQQDKLNKSLHPFKYYPVISLSFGYKIK